MSYESLLDAIGDLLSPSGTCAFVIPCEQEKEFTALARVKGLYPERITRVRGKAERPLKRSLLQMQREERPVHAEELVIEKERHVYTSDYISLVKDFYLKM